MSAGNARLINVSCPHHHERLVKGLWAVFNAKEGLDLDVRWGGQSIRAHQLVVQVFLSMDKLNHSTHGNHQRNKQEGTSNLSSLLEFLYNGCVTVREEQLDNLLQLANQLDFELLANAIESSKNDKQSGTGTIDNGQLQERLVPTGQTGERQDIKTNEKLSTLDVSERKAPVRKRLQLTRAKFSRKRSKKNNRNTAKGAPAEESSHREENDHQSEASHPDLTESDDFPDVNDCGSNFSSISDREDCREHTISPKLKPKSSVSTKHKKRPAKRKSLTSETSANKNYVAISSPQSSDKQSTSTLECRHCDYKTRSKTQFQVHASKHDPSITVFRCDACRRPFFSEDKFQLHRAKHDTYKCTHCDYVTVKRWNYYEHLFAAHQVNAKGEQVALLSCPLCPFKARANHELKYHTATKHLPEKPFKCQLCNFSAGRNSDIGVHIKVVHEKRKKFMCETCGFLAVTPFSLERHRVIHSGVKFFKCADCQASFKDRYALRRHQTLHATNNKNFVCEICGHAFNRRSNMKVHLKNVHKTLLDPVGNTQLRFPST